MSTEHDNHGRTPANWTGAMIPVGLIVWKVMAGMESSSDAG